MPNPLLKRLFTGRPPALLLTVGEVTEVAALDHSGTVIDLDAHDPATPIAAPRGAAYVVAQTYTDLRRAVSYSALLPAAAEVTVTIIDSPREVVVVPKLPEPHLVRSLAAHAETNGGSAVEATFAKATPIGQFLSAMMRGMEGNPATSVLRVAVTGAGSAHWRPGDPGAVPTTQSGPLEGPNGFQPADLVLRVVGRNPVPWEDNRVRVVDRPSPAMTTWASLGSTGATQQVGALLPGILQVDAIPPVDERAVNPIGFLSTPTSGPAVLVQKGDRWRVQDGPRELVSVHPSGAITDADVARLRGVRSVAVEWGRHTGPIAAVRSIAGLAAAGVPVTASSVPYWAESLGSELTEILTSAKPSDLDDDLRREEHSIRLRRAALRTHAVRSRWRRLATQAGAPVPAPPKVSVLLCTKRPDFIGMALAQIARQRHVDLEVILTLHGLPASLPEVRAAVAGFALPVTTVEVPGDALFGEALNRGAAAASGEYLAKWDDDDWYGPEFIADAVLAADYSGADLVGCLHQFIYLEQINLTIRRPGGESERFTRQISGNSLLMSRRTFAAAGGFPAIPRNVDTGLLRVVEAAGGRIYRTHGMASMVHRRESGHTWNAPLTGFIRAATHQWRGFKPGTLTEVHGIGEAVLASGREVPGSV